MSKMGDSPTVRDPGSVWETRGGPRQAKRDFGKVAIWGSVFFKGSPDSADITGRAENTNV